MTLRDATTPPPHMQPFIDSARVAHIAQALCDVMSAQSGGSDRFLQLAELPPVDRARMLDAATIALRSFDRAAVEVATWRAAQALAASDFGKRWFDLTTAEQQSCLSRAALTLNTYGAHLRGEPSVAPRLVKPTSRARRAVARVLQLVTPSSAPRATAVQS